MSVSYFTLSTSKERLDKISFFVQQHKAKDQSDLINKAIDKYFELAEEKLLFAFFYDIALPVFLFCMLFVFYAASPNILTLAIFFFSCIYLMFFVYVFIRKYRGVKFYAAKL